MALTLADCIHFLLQYLQRELILQFSPMLGLFAYRFGNKPAKEIHLEGNKHILVCFVIESQLKVYKFWKWSNLAQWGIQTNFHFLFLTFIPTFGNLYYLEYEEIIANLEDMPMWTIGLQLWPMYRRSNYYCSMKK